MRAKGLSLVNEYLRLALDPNGYLTLYDRRRRRPVFAGAGAIPLVIEDRSDTWSHSVDAFREVSGRFAKNDARLVEDGPVRGSLTVQYAWEDSRLTLEYRLAAGEPFATVRGRVDWRQQWQLLKLAFPVPFTSEAWTAEVPYGTTERATSGDEEPVQQWVDLSAGDRGLAIANDGRYACSAEPGELRVTILRSPPYAFHDPFLPGDFSLHPFTEQGVQTFALALIPHAGDWRESGIAEIARQLNRPPCALSEAFHPGPLSASAGFVRCAGKGVYIAAIKEAEDGGGLIVRAAEWCGRRRQARFSLPALERAWSAAFRPHQIKTFFVPDDRRRKVREVNMLEE